MTIELEKYESDEFSIQNALLSIITVCYNDVNRLAKTINSLESFCDDERFEHIVIDGKSDDKTMELILEASRCKNFKWLSELDKGIYDAMNKGIGLASGRFLLFLNCGDRMVATPDQMNAWLRPIAQADEADIVCFCCLIHDGNNTTVLKPRSGIFYKLPTSHQAMVFSKLFMRSHPYDIQYRIAADFSLYLSAKIERILIFPGSEPLTEIEAVGVASEDPFQSYKEYLQIANKKMRGSIIKWISVFLICCKGIAKILINNTLPREWVSMLRRRM